MAAAFIVFLGASDFLVELRGFEPMAIAGPVRSRVGSPLGDSFAYSRPPRRRTCLRRPPLDIEAAERTFVVTSA